MKIKYNFHYERGLITLVYVYILIFIAITLIVFFIKKFNKEPNNEKFVINDALLSHDELMLHAIAVAKSHAISKRKKNYNFLFSRLHENYKFIFSVYKQLNDDTIKQISLCPASEWLLDNFYIIEEQYKDLRLNINNDFFKELKIIDKGPLKGYPRVFAISLELISHTDGRIDKAQFTEFIDSYQKVNFLTMAEINAIFPMIRISIIEKIRYVCEKILNTQIEWENVDKLKQKPSNEIITDSINYINAMKFVNSSYIEHLLNLLKKEEFNHEAILSNINSRLIEFDIDIEKVVNSEHQEQAGLQITMGNCITSLRLVGSLDFEEMFEELSIVEKILINDPSDTYRNQDFESRDYYRHKIELLSKGLKISETKIARGAISCAKNAFLANSELKLTHVGYYLIGDGKNKFLSILRNSNSNSKVKTHLYYKYIFTILFFSLAITIFLLFHAYNSFGKFNILLAILIGFIFWVPSSEIVINITNKIITRITPPSFLPKLEYVNGITDENSTIVIVPTLIRNKKRAEELIEQLEVTYLANYENNMYFALVGDLLDATEMSLKEDNIIIDTALSKIKELNNKYARSNNIFFFFMRERTFCKEQNKWLGYERKRGAIIEFNDLIKGSNNTTYNTISGDITSLKNVKYVITLDADTIMPIGNAKKLIGTISHPLNIAYFDETRGVVTQGYGLIQPRIGLNIKSTNKSLFSRIFAGQGGIDPYTSAISDIYQDLFDEGIFTGKGIYDIDIFRKALNNAIPDNSVLSHDLLEGSFLRVGLATDIELIDNYPESYSSYILRLHRWVRGDWQLIKWLLPTIKNKSGEKIKNPLSGLSKWKIFDNLRRSMISTSLMLIFVMSIFTIPKNIFIYIGFGFLTIFLPLIMGLFEYTKFKNYRFSNQRLNGNLIYGLKSMFFETLLVFLFLPYHCYMMVNAISKTLYRTLVSRRNLLEWVTAADVEKNMNNDFKSFFKRMSPPIAIVYVLSILAIVFNKNNMPYTNMLYANILYTFLLAIIWSFSPLVAYYISNKNGDNNGEQSLSEDEIKILRRITRKTWHFYETFTGAFDNYLPPDNYQIYPVKRIAHRTSPTNIGFYLISVLAAKDLGYISVTSMLKKLTLTLNTLEKMEKWNGHIYNWYDTNTLNILRPKYISTVDSGNLVSYLITLNMGLLQQLDTPLLHKQLIDGILDTLSLGGDDDSLAINITKDFICKENFEVTQYNEFINCLIECSPERNVWECSVLSLAKLLKEEIDAYFPIARIIAVMDEYTRENQTIWNFRNLLQDVNKNPSPIHAQNIFRTLLYDIDNLILHGKEDEDTKNFLVKLKHILQCCNENINNIINEIKDLCARINVFIDSTCFAKLYDPKVCLFSIGYNVEDDKLTNSYYDLLASECRTTSYIAVVKREVPVSHWFKLGRSLASIDGFKGLVSWTGTMFEYFMPTLTMKSYRNTLLDETYKTVLKAQIKYGKARNVPWGTSESGFYTFDLMLNYQYKAFGVPHLGLKRGLINDMVVSPYSTILGLPFSPRECISNMKALISSGLEGEYGFYEAVDYTPSRLINNSKLGIVESFMTHHQGMNLIALNNYLNNKIMIDRFHSSPMIKAGEFLLQERFPLRVIITKEHKEIIAPLKKIEYSLEAVTRTIKKLDSALPVCHILSNGVYSMLISNRGSGFSRKDDIYITRWREEITSRNYGFFIFFRDINSNNCWSNTYEPLNILPQKYEAKFSADKAEFFRSDGTVDTHTEICVSTEDNCEIRRVTISNNGSSEIVIECTSYFEAVLTYLMADIVHPAFSNLFIRTEVLKEYNSLIASRRARDEGGKSTFTFHTVTTEKECIGDFEYETDRYKFIGRNNNISSALELNHPLSNTVGAVLDPVMSLRKKVRIEPKKSVTLSFIIGITDSKENSIELSKKYYENSNIIRAFELAYMRSTMATKYLNLKASETECFDSMISNIIYLSPLRMKYEKYIIENKKSQQGLWSYGISGDIPIILVTIKDISDVDVVKDMVKAHEYWRTKNLRVDLVILNEDQSNYLDPLRNLIMDIVLNSNARDVLDSPGGIFIKNSKLMPRPDIVLFYTTARIVIKAELRNIKSQIKLDDYIMELPQLPIKKEFKGEILDYTHVEKNISLQFFNEYGGFNSDGNEYIIRLKGNTHTPAPWINVISNRNYGFTASESGSGYTWAGNSRENKLTQWSNDPVSDAPSEILYIRNESTGGVWNITPLPIREKESYKITHGMGYTNYEHFSHGIEQNLTVFVPITDETIKISIIKLKNITNIVQEFSLFYYVKPVLGVSEQITAPYIISELIENSDILTLRNPYNSDFGDKIAFIDTSLKKDSFTSDMTEFIGSSGSLSSPDALTRVSLSGRLGSGFYPCCALQNSIKLLPGEEAEFIFLLGEAQNNSEILKLTSKYRDINTCLSALSDVKTFWKEVLGTIQIKTPHPSMDIMMNSWLLYQTTVCRLWARSAFYQSGGAYGFRDQLQDILSLINILPLDSRNQILLHCQHQFIEGDVQHWWHPGTNDKGIRTKFSDDLLWLPYTVSEYVEKSGDFSVLNEIVGYIEDAPLKENEDERYGVPKRSDVKSSVYEHCIRAIDRSLKFGEHGLPLMGSGDWNDGMNTVGNKGKGESVWMGWFLCSVLTRFAPICKYMDENDRFKNYCESAEKISSYIEENAWDGEWYRRAYFDDGTPLGSSFNTECKIDSLAQSWAAISGFGNKDRTSTAMHSLEDYLIKRDEGLILLFTPPFDNGDLKPGYIRGYVPGVRENGGQYTHAATWVIYAFAKMGYGNKAFECFNLINPITHSMTQMGCARYKVEPYVMAADVYAVDPHTGRGGWTWYTGSSGWMYKVGLEEILGFKKKGTSLIINPCIPKDWPQYSITYRYLDTIYDISVKNPNGVESGVKSVSIDGVQIKDKSILLLNNKITHDVEVILG